ncbi:uncharacterized protein TNCV_2977291 [Trichonephila clavipes]|nr:uncharacterized protein TNCV_2977291 [Trichonephila clavipes]
MDPIDAFPKHLSTTVVPVTLPTKPDALEYAARQGQVHAGIIYQEPTAKRVFVLFCKDHWHQKKTWLENFKRAVMEAKHVNEFRRNDVMWEKTSKGLLRNPDRLLKNTDKRMVYIYNNIFFAKKDFTFGLRTVKSGEIHLIQTTHVPMLIYELPASSLMCRAQPNVIRRSFEPLDQMLYHRTILEPLTAYPIPAGTNYIVLTVQKTAFGLDIIPESLLLQLIQKGFQVGDFRKMKKFNQTPYKLPPPTPIHVPAEKRSLEEKSLPKKRVRITPVMRRVSRRSELPMAPVQIPDVLEPVQIPDVLEPVQIPDVLEPSVQIPQPPVQIPDVLEPPVQIPLSHNHLCSTTCADSSVTSPTATYADSPRTYEHSACIRTCADSRCSRTCADSSVTSPTATYADSTCIRTCADSRCSRTCADSSVTSPTATYADSTCIRTCEDSTCIRTCADSTCIRTCADSTCSRTCQIPPVQSLTEPMQLLPELDILDPLESTDAFDQLMSFVFRPQELQLLHTVPSIFDGDLFSFLDEFERESMDLTLPRLNSCVKKSIGFKPIQPMDLSVNSSIGQ